MKTGEPLSCRSDGEHAGFNPRPSVKTGEQRRSQCGRREHTRFNPRPSVKTGEQRSANNRIFGIGFNPRPSVKTGEPAASAGALLWVSGFQSTPVSEDGRTKLSKNMAGASEVSIHARQ